MSISLQFTFIAIVCLVAGALLGRMRQRPKDNGHREAELIIVSVNRVRREVCVTIRDRLGRGETVVHMAPHGSEALCAMLADANQTLERSEPEPRLVQ